MALLGIKRLHLIITDSRGIGLGDLLLPRNMTGEPADVLVREGATLFDMVEVAAKHLHKNPFDVVYIAGGACDITFKDKKTGKIVYAWGRGNALNLHLLDTLNKASEKLSRDYPASRVVFCPLIASELSRVVNSGTVTTEDQTAVEDAIWDFNTALFKFNKEHKVVSPSLHHQVHRFCKGKKKSYYHHLEDGIHLTDYLKTKWADEFATVMAHN